MEGTAKTTVAAACYTDHEELEKAEEEMKQVENHHLSLSGAIGEGF